MDFYDLVTATLFSFDLTSFSGKITSNSNSLFQMLSPVIMIQNKSRDVLTVEIYMEQYVVCYDNKMKWGISSRQLIKNLLAFYGDNLNIFTSSRN